MEMEPHLKVEKKGTPSFDEKPAFSSFTVTRKKPQRALGGSGHAFSFSFRFNVRSPNKQPSLLEGYFDMELERVTLIWGSPYMTWTVCGGVSPDVRRSEVVWMGVCAPLVLTTQKKWAFAATAGRSNTVCGTVTRRSRGDLFRER